MKRIGKVVAIIQARTGSTRLPSKVFADLAGAPMLERVINRVGRARRLDEVVIATTDLPADDGIEQFCNERKTLVHRGSPDDLLDRYYQTARARAADVVVRITSDCPLIEPEIIDKVVDEYEQGQPKVEYSSNTVVTRTYPRGLDAEAIRFDALERSWREDTNPAWREHATPYIYRHPERFVMHIVTDPVDRSAMRWTVDTPEDLAFIRRIYDHFGHDRFSWRDVIALLDEHPDWSAMNADVSQKVVP